MVFANLFNGFRGQHWPAVMRHLHVSYGRSSCARRDRLPLGGTLVVFVLLLGGCALPFDREPQSGVSHADLQARIDRLDGSLTSSCATAQQVQLEQQAEHREALRTDLRETNSLVRQLRDKMTRLEGEDDESEVTSQCSDNTSDLGDKEVLGRSEWIGLPNVGTHLNARVDTGAATSSLSAIEITGFERDGEDWVRFKLGLNDDDDVVDSVRGEWIEAPVERRVRIIQASGEHSRPVISLMMTLGSLRERVQFTLNDRTHLDHPALLGRRFMMDIAVVDVGREYPHERPEYPEKPSADDADDDEDADRTDEADE